jgi:hypothetical protein
MKRFLVAWLVIIVLVIIGIVYSWTNYPEWRNPTSGGFWVLVGIAFVTVWKGFREVVGLWNDVNESSENKESQIQFVQTQQARNIFNVPGGIVNFQQEDVETPPSKNMEDSSPQLELRFIDKFGRYLEQIILEQTIPNQNFHFNIALMNNNEKSLPAEKLDITIECSWDGTDITNPPKFKTDIYERTTKGWKASRELIQQGDQPFPAVLTFRGSGDDRCAHGHPLEWHRFSVVVFEKMHGKFVLDYGISSADPKAVTSKGVIHIIMGSEKFGTKSSDIKDVLTGEQLHIEINFQKDEAYINGVRVKRQRRWENNDRVWIFSPIDNPSKQYHLSSGQIEQMKNIV